ncbi:MAG: DUF4422 domain-containing protein [Lachnospiraceae bacterium]
MDLAIYGAGAIALGAYEAIHNLYPVRNIRCFLVTKQEENEKFLSGIPVMTLEHFSRTLSLEEKENIEVLIATPENVMSVIETNLEEKGLYCHVRLTSARWSELMRCYYACEREYMSLRALPVGYHKADIHVFMAKFYKDKPLTSRYDMPDWICPIQVGAMLCQERVADIVDCEGVNISAKNGNYSELTALYWLWKNRLAQRSSDSVCEYYGLVHYRRMLELTEDDVLRLSDNDVDVVLPYPMPYEPDIEEHHKRYLKREDWEAVQRAVREIRPEYAGTFSEILGQKYFYNYNIILARKEVLEQYCSWLFPILERTEALSVPKGMERADRYIGYVGETLMTVYFMHHKNKLNIMHTGCQFLV